MSTIYVSDAILKFESKCLKNTKQVIINLKQNQSARAEAAQKGALNPYNWTFPNCNMLHNAWVHKQNNKRVIFTSSVWENLFNFWSLAIRLAKKLK